MLAPCLYCATRTAVPRPAPAALAALHDSEDYRDKPYFEARRGQHVDTPRRVQRLLELVRTYRPELGLCGRRLLDVGCDTADFPLAVSAAAGMVPYGVDVSHLAVDEARARGVNAVAGDLANTPRDFCDFAIVTALDVIEHVAEPRGLLSDVAVRLADDGLFYLETPNWLSAVYQLGRAAGGARPRRVFERVFPREHMQYFTPAGLRLAVEGSGLRLVGIGTRALAPSAVAGGACLRIMTWAAQLPDRGDRRLLLWTLLERDC
jgi:2-polyprenyl-3-methyl-5-hydroxy-6-metoxy-1,4-benzoquinol methylase